MESSSSHSGLVRVSKSSPCPHCNKTDWCYSIGELSVCKRSQPPATGWEATSKADTEGTLYYAPIQEKKAVRPAKTSYFSYPARDGSPFVRVKRIDFGDGQKKDFKQERWENGKWVSGLGEITYRDIPLYCYGDIQEAIFKNELIFITEGETCADVLWELGLAATCNIGGSGKWQQSNSRDLKNAKIVICPDRDQPGVAFANKLAGEFPSAMWLYAYPDSKAWDNLPQSQGLDVKDWIETYNLTAEDVLAAVGERRQPAAEPIPVPENKIINHPRFQAPDIENLEPEIEKLLEQDLKRSQLQLKITGLAQTYRLSSSDVWKIYRDREQELEQEADRDDVATEVERLLSATKSQLPLSEIIPTGLAVPIEKLAGLLNLRPECYLATLLTQVASLFKTGTEVLLRRDTDWRCTPNYFTGIVAEVSQKKSPVPVAMIDRPMRKLRERAKQEYEKAKSAYEEEVSQWKATKKDEDRGAAPVEPRQKIYNFDKATGEGIIYQAAAHPDQGLMYYTDELAGLFKSANQYRGGKGSDEEDLLSFWNGKGSTVLRASGVKASVEHLLLSVFGTIQPDVLAYHLRDCSDSNGKFARFDFVYQPLAASSMPDEDSGGNFDLTPMLTDLYEKMDALPATFFELDKAAKKYLAIANRAIEKKRIAEPRQGMRGALGKMPEKIGKLAITIHAINCVFNGQPLTPAIPKSAVAAAAKFVKFTADQIAAIYTEFSDRTALAPSLTKILLLAERKGGIISVRDAQRSFSGKQPSAQQTREWFAELTELGYGTACHIGKGFGFQLNLQKPLTELTLASNPVSETVSSVDSPLTLLTVTDTSIEQVSVTVSNCQYTTDTSKPLQDMGLTPSVSSVSGFCDFEKIDRETIDECVGFIKIAIAQKDSEHAKITQGILAEQNSEIKKAIWDSLSPEEKADFKILLATDTDTTDTCLKPLPVEAQDCQRSTDTSLTVTDTSAELLENFQQIASPEDLQDFADWLEDPIQLEKLVEISENPQIKLWWGQIQG